MKKLTIIIGERGSGKMEMAERLVFGKNACFVKGLHRADLEEACFLRPEALVIQAGGGAKAKHIVAQVVAFLKAGEYSYRPPYSEKMVGVPFPEAIVILRGKVTDTERLKSRYENTSIIQTQKP